MEYQDSLPEIPSGSCAWCGEQVTEGYVGPDGKSRHPDCPTDEEEIP